jgi:chromosome segregation ATPase
LDSLKNDSFNKIKQIQDQSERRLRDLEATLSKAYTNLRNLDKQNEELSQMKLDLEEEVRQRERQQREVEQDIKELLRYQEESQVVIKELKDRADKKAGKAKYYKETLIYRE